MRNLGDDLIKGLKEARAYMQGKKNHAIKHRVAIKSIDVKKIRQKMHLSRMKFANKYGFSHRTLQHWEQGDRKPQGAALVLLNVIAKCPKAIEQALNR